MLIECSHSGNTYLTDKRCLLVINEPERKKKTNIMDRISYQKESERERERKELELFSFFITVHPSMIEGRMCSINSFMTIAHTYTYIDTSAF
jgi:hypothetical protein